MATKKETLQPSIVNRENIVQLKKEAGPSRLPKCRPALRDVGNKVQVAMNVISKMRKPEVEDKKTEITKVPNNVKRIIPRPLKREESVVVSKPSFSTGQLPTIIDPDIKSKKSVTAVVEYLEDIYAHLRDMECKLSINEDYMKNHQSTPPMRAVLIDWIADVHLNFKMCIETLHMTVAIIDRYLQKDKLVAKDTLQLVGTSAMMIASKYEEIYSPDIKDFVYVCDDAFSAAQILEMEKKILLALDFSLGRPCSIHFLRRYSKVAQVTSIQHNLGKYLLELALLYYKTCHIRPSYQAAAACCLSVAILNNELDLTKVWTPTMVHYTTYELSDFLDVIVLFANILDKVEHSKHQTIREKFANSAFSKISTDARLKGQLVKKLVLEGPKKS